jgi:hypothetical protein
MVEDLSGRVSSVEFFLQDCAKESERQKTEKTIDEFARRLSSVETTLPDSVTQTRHLEMMREVRFIISDYSFDSYNLYH